MFFNFVDVLILQSLFFPAAKLASEVIKKDKIENPKP
jgi:hypothetical protein